MFKVSVGCLFHTECIMKHREEIGKLLDRIDEQQATINKLQEENASLKRYKI